MKVYEVFIRDQWDNIYLIGFFNTLEDEVMIEGINQYISNPKFHVKVGDIKEYPSTFGPIFDTNVVDIVSSRDNTSDEDYDELIYSDDNISIRGFILDSDKLEFTLNLLKLMENNKCLKS